MRSGFGQFCPVAVACEVFAERWTPMIVRELLAGSDRFNEIHRGVPLMSRALLSRRLIPSLLTPTGLPLHLPESVQDFFPLETFLYP